MPHLLRLPLLLLALSLPVTTSYGRVYSLSPHLGDVGGGMRVNLTGRDFVDYGDVHHMARRALGDSEGTPEQGDPINEPLASSVVCQLPPLELPVDHPNRDEPVRVCVEVTTNNDPDQATDDCQLFTYFDD